MGKINTESIRFLDHPVLYFQTMKHSSAAYDTPAQLFAEHGVTTPSGYAREAYDLTSCGVWTTYLLAEGSIPSADLHPSQDTAEWAAKNIVGVKHGTIVEGSDAEFEADPLFFPFDDEELADAWQYLEDCVNSCGE